MGFDKVLHLIAGGAITALAIGLGAGWPLAALAGCLAGVAKETVDQVGGRGTPDALDSAATSLGALLGAGLTMVM